MIYKRGGPAASTEIRRHLNRVLPEEVHTQLKMNHTKRKEKLNKKLTTIYFCSEWREPKRARREKLPTNDAKPYDLNTVSFLLKLGSPNCRQPIIGDSVKLARAKRSQIMNFFRVFGRAYRFKNQPWKRRDCQQLLWQFSVITGSLIGGEFGWNHLRTNLRLETFKREWDFNLFSGRHELASTVITRRIALDPAELIRTEDTQPNPLKFDLNQCNLTEIRANNKWTLLKGEDTIWTAYSQCELYHGL